MQLLAPRLPPLLRQLVLGAILAALALAAAVPACADPTPEQRLRFYRDVGLAAPETGRPPTVVRWDQPIWLSVLFMEPAPVWLETALSGVVKDAAEAGAPVLYRSAPFNAAVVFADLSGPKRDFFMEFVKPFFDDNAEAVGKFIDESRAAGDYCPMKFHLEGPHILGGVLLIDSTGRDVTTLRHCAVRGMARLMGLGALDPDGTRAVASIANPSQEFDRLTDEDRRFLKFLFGQSVHSGISEEEFIRAAQQAIKANRPR